LEVKGSPKPFVNFHPENVFQKRPQFQWFMVSSGACNNSQRLQ
jgi:hypothetical protein